LNIVEIQHELNQYVSQFFDFGLLNRFKKIYCLVSGGIDSTLLANVFQSIYGKKVIFVNCFNPYENSPTLDYFISQPNFIEIRNSGGLNYKDILVESFQQLNFAADLRKKHKYNKKIFPCCRYIKHNAFKKDPLFMDMDVVVVSGIKSGDGSQRNAFLSMLRNGKKFISQSLTPNNYYFLKDGVEKPTFFHLHKEGQTYVYPFRDYMHREFPEKIINMLKVFYPNIAHSGCAICPVLVLFNIKAEGVRYHNSVDFMKKHIKPSRNLISYVSDYLNTKITSFF
jgi:3'-phosphoadenosine 5'-phosphosulfate sulfotransferase (PAPS reductase)/FAD synthetase